MSEKPSAGVVAALIWDRQGRFMICQRPRNKKRGLLWEFVGGKIEPGEAARDALIRECEEELAITVRPGSIFMEVDHDYPDLTVHMTLFNTQIEKGVPVLLEHEDIAWIRPDEIKAYDFCPADQEILERIQYEYGMRHQQGPEGR